MSNRAAKTEEKVMSEVRENGEDNGWQEFTLHSTSDEYDVTFRMQVEGCAAASLFKLMQPKFTHLIGQEASSRMVNRDKDKYPDGEAFQDAWRKSKVADIISGKYAEGASGRSAPRGPRMSELEVEERTLAAMEVKERFAKNNDPKSFPKTSEWKKALINGQTVDYWIKAVLAKYPEMREKAKRNVDARHADAEAARARVSSTSGDAFADLAA